MERLLELGSQPICHRYTRQGESEALFPLSVAACLACGLVQLDHAPTAEALKPIYDWIKQPEPEAHLDKLAAELARRFKPDALVLGATEKDDPLLDKLKALGFSRARRLVPESDAGKADLVLSRFTLEHQHDIAGFLRGLSAAVSANGQLSIEVPDSEKALGQPDVSALWEEHLAYFTEATLASTLRANGLSVAHFGRFGYTQEDALWTLASKGGGRPAAPDLSPARRFAASVPERKRQVREALKEAARRGPVAFFGAGHRGCVYINAFELAPFIGFVVDDHPKKKGMFMPGSRLPIVGSEELLRRGARLCLFGVNPDVEPKIVAAQSAFAKAGGTFASICADSAYAMPLPAVPS
jgi:hypothetical protein